MSQHKADDARTVAGRVLKMKPAIHITNRNRELVTAVEYDALLADSRKLAGSVMRSPVPRARKPLLGILGL